MRAVYKYEIKIKEGKQILHAYSLCNVLSFKMQGGNPYVWVEVNTEMPEKDIVVEVFGTGWEMPFDTNLVYIGTIVDNQFSFEVYHLYQYL